MKTFSALFIALALLIGLISPAAAQDNLPPCEMSFNEMPDDVQRFFRSANDRVEALTDFIDSGIEDGDVKAAAIDLMRWATLADLALNMIYIDVEVPECEEAAGLYEVYQKVIDGTYRLAGHLYIGVDTAGTLPSDRVILVLPDRVRGLVIELAIWKVYYEDIDSQ